MIIAAVVPNVFDRGRFGPDVVFVDEPHEATTAGAELVLVDLDRCNEVAPWRLDAVHVIGFGSHVDRDRHAEAEAAGYDEVLARSVFFRRLPRLLSGDRTAPPGSEDP